MKLGCDGNDPCKTCRQKKLECKFSRLKSKGLSVRNDGMSNRFRKDRKTDSELATSKNGADINTVSDRGSIKFLLNSGTASFIECFRFPSSHERRNLFNFRNTHWNSDAANTFDFFGNGSENGSAYSDPFEEDAIDWSLFEDENLLRFLSSPFSEYQTQTDDIFAPMLIDSNFSPTTIGAPFPVDWEPPTLQSEACVQGILQKAISIGISPQEQADISQHLNYLFTPSRITKLVNLYFEFWHPHCPIVHQGSFSVQTTPISLSVAVVLMGAMYSQVDRDVTTAKTLLDLAELYIYSMDDLTEEFEVRQMMRAASTTTPESIALSMLAFQHLQAAYLMVCVQFWAGNMVSRKRAIDTRFSVVIKACQTVRNMDFRVLIINIGCKKARSYESTTRS